MLARGAPLEDALRETIGAIPSVQVAYFFGSRASGRPRPDSDVDVAIAFERGTDPRAREDARRRIVAGLTDALGGLGERVDVVDLDEADSAVGFRAIRDGRLLFARTERERVRLVVRIARRHDDDAPRRALFRAAARAVAARMAR